MHVPGFEVVFENAVIDVDSPVFADDLDSFYVLCIRQGECGCCLVAPHSDGEEIRRTIVVFGHYGDRYGFVAR